MAINRKSFSSIIPAEQQAGMLKVIVANVTPKGYLHLVAVRTSIVNEAPTEHFVDVMIHPDRAMAIDIAKFDAVSLQGLTPRLAAGEAKTNTTYHWGVGAKAIGRHLVTPIEVETGEPKCFAYAGVGLYGDAEQGAE